MRISPTWLREFVDLKVDGRQLADDLTLAGVAVESVRQIEGQTLFEMEIGTNRPDAMCHYGVARECSAIYDLSLKPITPRLPQVRPAAKPFPIEIQDPAGCGRYTGRVVRHVKIASSPAKILDRLQIDEHGGVSNAVDASNYTLMELGHPTHAFDLDKLEGGKIIIRRAHQGETLKTLDGVERKLDPEDLIIADAVRPVGLAGIMGGLDSAISDSTKNILIESAWFDPATVRKTARRLGMHTNASHIFERGADWGATPLACNRVAELALENAGGELEGELVDVVARRIPRHALLLRRDEILRLLGQEIPDREVLRILARLGFSVTARSSDELKALVAKATDAPPKFREMMLANAEKPAWMVDLPSWRLDIEREIDLLEEIARIYGYNKFSNTLPAFSGSVVERPDAAKETKLRSILLALGYNEAISPSFISSADARTFSASVPVPLANPLSEEQSVMRTSLVPGMLRMLAWNLNHGTSNARLFEMGNIFSAPAEEQTAEQKMICLGATGNAIDAGMHGLTRTYGFFDLKGDIETVLSAFEIRNLRFEPADNYHPGRSATAIADGKPVARFGQALAAVTDAFKIKQDVYLAEIYLDRLLQLDLRVPRYRPLSRFPAVDRDFSFSFDDAVTFAQISASVDALNIAELQSFQPAEIFRGGAVPPGKYSILLRARFQSAERTLRDDEVAQWSSQIIQALEALGGNLRAQ
ncbi:MAG TPA: phenylalanine--tRNA ligase subunit beta [Candidatus Angelobacter sp.]|nr:phenylalanine--tRNA ligase subunit beta [Candidatus Angelobacter sp.]